MTPVSAVKVLKSVVHALTHNRPQGQELFPEFRLAAPNEFVGEHDVGDGHALAVADAQEFVGRGEGVGQDGVIRHHLVSALRRAVNDEAAAD